MIVGLSEHGLVQTLIHCRVVTHSCSIAAGNKAFSPGRQALGSHAQALPAHLSTAAIGLYHKVNNVMSSSVDQTQVKKKKLHAVQQLMWSWLA